MKKAGVIPVSIRAFAFALLAAVPAAAQETSPPSEAPPVLVQQDWNRAVSARLQRAGAEVVARGSESGISGQFTAKVGFSVAADGMITDVKIAGSSGNAAVDQLAVQIPTLASPMPPFTPDMTPDAKAVVAPLQLNFEAPQTGDTTQP